MLLLDPPDSVCPGSSAPASPEARRRLQDAAAAAARAKAKMRREHQEVLARRAAEEAKVKRLQDQLAAMEGKEKGASPGARGRTTGRGHGGGSAGRPSACRPRGNDGSRQTGGD